jgi:hypothetical protein
MDTRTKWIAAIAGAGLLYFMSKKERQFSKHAKNPLGFYAPEEEQIAEHPFGLGNPIGGCRMGLSNALPNPERVNGFMINDFDTKTGRGLIWCFSLPRGLPGETGGSCIAATQWCSQMCYGSVGRYQKKLDPGVNRWYRGNFEIAKRARGDPAYFSRQMLTALWELAQHHRNHPKVMRIHVIGDFFHPDYLRAWITVAREAAKDGWTFYAYTRTWQIARQSSHWHNLLSEFANLSNVSLLLSTDPMSGPALSGWKECGIDVTYNRQGQICNHAVDNNTTCYACGKCWHHNGPSVYIPLHGRFSLAKQKFHAEAVEQRQAQYGFNPRRRSRRKSA